MKHRCLRQVVFTVALLFPALGVADTMDDVLREAKSKGLPVEALRHKIKEGRAKGVPEARIRAVVREMVRHMKQAREWIRKHEGKSKRKGAEAEKRRLMISLAQARMAGLSEAGLRSMVTLQKGAASRVDALVDLHLRGYRNQHALQLAKRASMADVGTIGATLDGLRKGHSLTHAEAADLLLRAVRGSKGSLSRAMRTITHRYRQGAAAGGVKPRARSGSTSKKGKP
jgi:hypothetical protein